MYEWNDNKTTTEVLASAANISLDAPAPLS